MTTTPMATVEDKAQPGLTEVALTILREISEAEFNVDGARRHRDLCLRSRHSFDVAHRTVIRCRKKRAMLIDALSALERHSLESVDKAKEEFAAERTTKDEADIGHVQVNPVQFGHLCKLYREEERKVTMKGRQQTVTRHGDKRRHELIRFPEPCPECGSELTDYYGSLMPQRHRYGCRDCGCQWFTIPGSSQPPAEHGRQREGR